jgi:hypothetical protein
MIGRVLLKAALLFVALNLLCAGMPTLDSLGRMSLYNRLWPGRLRLPYGEVTERAYNLSLDNVPAMLASHAISRPKAANEFRVVLLGDSGVWGWLLNNDDTLAGALNDRRLTTPDGGEVIVYNLGYPVLSLTKDLLLQQAVLAHEPDQIIWLVTLDSFPWASQLDHPLLQQNPARLRPLIEQFELALDAGDPRLAAPSWTERTVVGRRRPLADLLRLQLLGLAWASTGVDQEYPEVIELRRSDFDTDLTWQGLAAPQPLGDEQLAGAILAAGQELAGDTPLLIVNEPIFVSSGVNSHLRYNAWYPRWAYDAYRAYLAEQAATRHWSYLDLWDRVEPAFFTDTPVHLTAAGSRQLAAELAGSIGR